MTYPLPMDAQPPVSGAALERLPNTHRRLAAVTPANTNRAAVDNCIATALAAGTPPAGVGVCLHHPEAVRCLDHHSEHMTEPHPDTCTECEERPGLHQLTANADPITLGDSPLPVGVVVGGVRLCIACAVDTL